MDIGALLEQFLQQLNMVFGFYINLSFLNSVILFLLGCNNYLFFLKIVSSVFHQKCPAEGGATVFWSHMKGIDHGCLFYKLIWSAAV